MIETNAGSVPRLFQSLRRSLLCALKTIGGGRIALTLSRMLVLEYEEEPVNVQNSPSCTIQ